MPLFGGWKLFDPFKVMWSPQKRSHSVLSITNLGNKLHYCVVSLLLMILVNASTSIITEDTAYIREGEDLNVSCVSYGIPTPTITWMYNDLPAPFSQSFIRTDYVVFINNGSGPNVTTGNTLTILHIVDFQNLTDSGVYTCIGSNSYNEIVSTNSAFIDVQLFSKCLLSFS